MIKKIKEKIIKFSWKKKEQEKANKELVIILENNYIKKEVENFFNFIKDVSKHLYLRNNWLKVEKIKSNYIEKKEITIKSKKNIVFKIIIIKYFPLKENWIFWFKKEFYVNDKLIISLKNKKQIKWNYSKFKKYKGILFNLLDKKMSK